MFSVSRLQQPCEGLEPLLQFFIALSTCVSSNTSLGFFQLPVAAEMACVYDRLKIFFLHRTEAGTREHAYITTIHALDDSISCVWYHL